MGEQELPGEQTVYCCLYIGKRVWVCGSGEGLSGGKDEGYLRWGSSNVLLETAFAESRVWVGRLETTGLSRIGLNGFELVGLLGGFKL